MLQTSSLTLPGIAGIILTIGMAVDANVLIYERLREELARGKPLNVALNAGCTTGPSVRSLTRTLRHLLRR